jgi:hypothetical protein
MLDPVFGAGRPARTRDTRNQLAGALLVSSGGGLDVVADEVLVHPSTPWIPGFIRV